MKDLFQRVPLRQYQHYSSSHLHAGTTYHERSRDRPGRAAMWQLEEPVIEDIFTGLAPKRVLDFAAGTGRITTVLERCLPACDIHGIDISEDMLAIARPQCSRATFHLADGRQALQQFGAETFDAISAFRFFPNADPALREDAAEQIARLVRPGGHVILNNHRNFWSPSYVAMRAMGVSSGKFGTLNADMRSLFERQGFTCVRTYSLGVWPQTDFRPALLSWSFANALERFNLRHFSKMHTLGYNTIFVFEKHAG